MTHVDSCSAGACDLPPKPRHSMYAIYPYIDPPNHPNVGIYGSPMGRVWERECVGSEAASWPWPHGPNELWMVLVYFPTNCPSC